MKSKICFRPGVILIGLFLFLGFLSNPLRIFASEGERYVWISVDATDNNEGLTYALDTTEPGAFGPTSRFKVVEGTSHTIYVKDAAGNISSQDYSAISVNRSDDGNSGDVNLDIEVGDNIGDYEPGTYGKGTGTGTLQNELETDGSFDSKKLFYTVESQDGNTFYLVIDHTDQEDNVYFLDQVRLNDLQALATEGGQTLTQTQSDSSSDANSSLLGALSDDKQKAIEEATSGSGSSSSNNKSNGNGLGLFVILLVAVGGGAYYYFKVYSKKKDEALDAQDAHDMDDFEGEYDDDYDRYEYNEDDDDDDDDEAFSSVSSEDDIQSSAVSEAYLKEMNEDSAAEERNSSSIKYPDSIELPHNVRESEIKKDNSSSDSKFGFHESSKVTEEEEYDRFDDESEED